MHAAVVSCFDYPPRYETVEAPEPRDDDEVVVDVLAAAADVDIASTISGARRPSAPCAR